MGIRVGMEGGYCPLLEAAFLCKEGKNLTLRVCRGGGACHEKIQKEACRD